MPTDRRGFLRFTTAGVALLLGARGAARADSGAETALAIHRATRNTLTGAIGAGLRRFRDPLAPYKPYPDRPRLALPAPSWENELALFEAPARFATPHRFAREPLSREALARLLLLANGVTRRGSPYSRRAAPSAGALYAGELYAVVERVSGVAPGVYSYAVESHELVQVREGSLWAEVSGALERPDEAAGAAAAVLVTNVFARYAVRYANRGYRYALIDAGHIGENLRLAARELALHEIAPLRFEDDRLNALLGVDGREEAVCAVHGVGRASSDAAGKVPPHRALVERQVREPEGDWRDLAEPERYHEATKLVPPQASAAAHRAVSAGARVAVGAAAAGGSDTAAPKTAVHAAIRMRRSAARFESEPMRRADLLRVLGFARGEPALHRTPDLDLCLVVHRVSDTAPGLYRYDPASRELALVREGDLAGALVRADLGQERAGEAAAAVIGVARLADAEARAGARGYRDVLLDAGATAQRIYLAAEATGHAARNLAAFFDDSLDALLGLDGRTAVAVHLTAVGRGD